jgi:hypothetical protein
MSHMTQREYGQLKIAIAEKIEQLGYVPPMDDLVEEFGCPKTTAWRIVRSLGYRANYKHRWVKTETPKRDEHKGEE